MDDTLMIDDAYQVPEDLFHAVAKEIEHKPTEKELPLACGCRACKECYLNDECVSWWCTRGGYHYKIWLVHDRDIFWPLYNAGKIMAEVIEIRPESL
jgi:hypothetical protein